MVFDFEFWMQVVAILALALAMPLGILVSRNNVKSRRQEIIGDLEDFLRPADGDSTERNWQILPSFEFVKMKYFMGSRGQEREREFSVRLFSAPVLVFVAISALGFIGVFMVAAPGCFVEGGSGCVLGSGGVTRSIFLVGGDDALSNPMAASHRLEAAVTIALFAFLGGYAHAIRTLLRAVSNFDLAPITFFRLSAYMVIAVFISVATWRSMPTSIELTTGMSGAFPAWYGAAFLLGFVPGLAERHLVSLWRRGLLKEVDRRAIEASKTVPLEIIDGIDTDTRVRLEDSNLYDAQHLATANPIMLFVETPFGIYQSIDWVAQAQLVVGVGVERYLALRHLGVRTIFDLETVFFPRDAKGVELEPCEGLEYRVALILLNGDADRDAARRLAVIEEGAAIADVVLDDLATRRLRQIKSTIEHKLRAHGVTRNGRKERPSGASP